MNPPNREKTPSTEVKESAFKTFLARRRKRHIIETFAGFIAGGWLFLEFVDRILIAHYHINEKWLDVAFFTLLGALLCVILWRWFRGTEKRPGNVKAEVLLVPLVILVTLAIDMNLVLKISAIPGKALLIGIVALCLGIAWVIFKSLQWAALGQPVPTGQADQQRVRSDRDLGQIVAATSTEPIRIRSLAVLPLANLSRDPEQEYFADGMTEELITSLARFSELRVISRTSSMHFKGSKKTLPEIAKQLNVDGIVEGTVRRAGDRVRISAQLIHAPTDQHIWAENYERDLNDILALQSEVARAIADEIQVKLSPQDRARLARTRRVDPEAYEAYLRGRQQLAKTSPEAFEKGLEFFELSIEKDPDYAPSHAALAECYCFFGLYGLYPVEVIFPKAKASAIRALQLDNSLSEAHAVLGWVLWQFAWDFSGAEQEFKQAIELNPSSAIARWQYADLLVLLGRKDEAVSQASASENLDPLSDAVAAQAAYVYVFAHRYEEAIGHLRRALEVGSSTAVTHAILAWTYLQNGMLQEAAASAAKAVDLSGPGKSPVADAWLIDCYVILGSRDEAVGLLRVWEQLAAQGHVEPYLMAVFYAAVGDFDAAFDWWNRAFEQHSATLLWINCQIPAMNRISSDPRFRELLARINFPGQHLESS